MILELSLYDNGDMMITVQIMLNMLFLCLHIHRDTAQGVKAEVDQLLTGFGSVEGALADAEEKLQNSMDRSFTFTFTSIEHPNLF